MMLEIQNFVKPIKGLLASLVVGMINCWFGMGPGMNISNPAAAGISSITFRTRDQRTINGLYRIKGAMKKKCQKMDRKSVESVIFSGIKILLHENDD